MAMMPFKDAGTLRDVGSADDIDLNSNLVYHGAKIRQVEKERMQQEPRVLIAMSAASLLLFSAKSYLTNTRTKLRPRALQGSSKVSILSPHAQCKEKKTQPICLLTRRPHPPTQRPQKPQIRAPFLVEYSKPRDTCLLPKRTRIARPACRVVTMLIDVPVGTSGLED